MSNGETRTYRGDSLEALLPQIRRELGADAVVTRRREGVSGGIGGFFGKRTVEVEAQASAAPPAPEPPPSASLPPRVVLDAYDTGEPATATFEHLGGPSLVDELIGQASPFADRLADALDQQSTLVPALTAREVEAALARAAVPPPLVRELLEEAAAQLAPFTPGEPLAVNVRAALARRFRVRHRGRAVRRRVALVGPSCAGRTLAAAKLAGAYARSGIEVCALSLEPAAAAFELAAVTRPFEVGLEVAQTPAEVELVRRRLAGADFVVADTPAFDVDEPVSAKRISGLLAAFRPTETHLVLPAGVPRDRVRVIVAELRRSLRIDAILLTHADTGEALTPLGAALRERLPVSYVADGPLAAGGIRPAEPDALAALVLA